MVAFLTTLGSADLFATALPIFAVVLWLTGLVGTLRGLILGLLLVAAMTVALKLIVATPGTTTWPDGILISQYFPSGHAAMATAVYGSVAVILAGAGGGIWRYAPMVALVLAVAIAASRVIARMHPMGDAFFGMLIGLGAPLTTAWSVVRERHPWPPAPILLLAFVAAIAMGWLAPLPVRDLLPW